MTWQDELMKDVMMKEYQNDVLDIVLKPESNNVVSYKWIYKIKYVADRSKERLVARGTLTPGSKVHFLQNYDGSCFHDEVKTSLP